MTAVPHSASITGARITPARPLRAVPSATARRAPLRLTRRGRLVLAVALLAVVAAVSLFVGGSSMAGTHATHAPVSYVTVTPGQTLWEIAGDVAPDADRRDTVAQIVELNALPSSGVLAGQRIAVPAR